MQRNDLLSAITLQLRVHKVCALLGARQVGKTTLAKEYIKNMDPKKVFRFDLENHKDIEKFENPMLLLTPLMQEGNIIIIDEIQMRPNLFPTLRVLVDEHKGKLLILGSASRDLIRQSSETLAGRIGFVDVTPFTLQEVESVQPLWLRGGFPLAYLANNEEESFAWREAYIRTFLERDIPALGFNIPAQQMRRFWMMLTHYHGQTLNITDIARSLAISNYMVTNYLDVLIGTFMMRSLQPWIENISKRQVKAPKIYFRDSGILHTLLNIRTHEELTMHPRLGAFWEGFALEEIIRHHKASDEECFFWATQAGGELDLLLHRGGKRIGFEFKYGDVPKTTKSMHLAIEDLKLDHLYVIYPGTERFPMTEKITACGLEVFRTE